LPNTPPGKARVNCCWQLLVYYYYYYYRQKQTEVPPPPKPTYIACITGGSTCITEQTLHTNTALI
jgi:hypothetical protein